MKVCETSPYKRTKPSFKGSEEVNDVQSDSTEESKEFKKVVKELKNFAEKSDNLLETFIRAEESWFWNTVLKMMK